MLTVPHNPWGRATMTPPPPFWPPHPNATPACLGGVLFPVVSDVETSNWSLNQQPSTSLDQQSGHLLAWLKVIRCPMQSHTEGCVGPAPKNAEPLSLTDQHLWATFASGQVVAVAVNTHCLLGIAVLMCVTLCHIWNSDCVKNDIAASCGQASGTWCNNAQVKGDLSSYNVCIL